MSAAGPFAVEQIGRTVVVTPLANLTELGSEELLEGDAGGAVGLLDRGEAKNVIINCERMDRCCSSGVGLFIKLWKRAQANHGRIVFCNLSPHLRQLIEVLRLDKMWPVFNSLDEALDHVKEV